jgi:hypothetical protein
MRVSNGGRGPKRRSAAEAFVEDGTQRVNIRRRADILAAGGLLGRHVAGRANDAAGAGGAVLVELLSQAEIGDLGDEIPPGFTSGSGRYRAGQCGAGQQHIGGLEVAVDDPRFVRGVHGTGQRLHQTGSLYRLERMFAELGIERATRAELQGHVRPAVVFADLKNLHDVGMLQAGDSQGFDAKAVDLGGTGVCPGEDHLQGTATVQPHVAG